MSLRFIRAAIAFAASEGVERPAAGAAPSAFRIWHSGDNPTDHGVHKFTPKSAELLMREQSTRGNLYSIDVDHLSLNQSSPPESRKAVGWHRLEVRQGDGGPELWAVDVQWTEAVRAGLEKDVPEWRFFSPAYNVANKTSEIVSYLNTALTNNPATWKVTALASRASQERCMNYKSMRAALLAWAGDDEEKKKDALATLKATFPDEKEPDGDEAPAKEPAKEPKAESEDPPAATAKASEAPSEEQKSSIAATKELATTVAQLERKLDGYAKEKEAAERAAILASRKDLPESLVKTLIKLPLAMMRETIAGIPVPQVDPAAASQITATRGDTQGHGGETDTIRAARLPPAEREELASRFGTSRKTATVHWERNALVFPADVSREEAHRILAKHNKAATDPTFSPLAPKAAEGALR